MTERLHVRWDKMLEMREITPEQQLRSTSGWTSRRRSQESKRGVSTPRPLSKRGRDSKPERTPGRANSRSLAKPPSGTASSALDRLEAATTRSGYARRMVREHSSSGAHNSWSEHNRKIPSNGHFRPQSSDHDLQTSSMAATPTWEHICTCELENCAEKYIQIFDASCCFFIRVCNTVRRVNTAFFCCSFSSSSFLLV